MSTSGRPYLRRVLVGTVAATAGNLWTIVLGVVTLPLLVHNLGPSDFGVFALLQVCNGTTGYLSIASVGAGVAGLRLVASRGASGDDEGTARALGALIVVGAGIGVAGGLVFAAGGPYLFEALLGERAGGFTAVARWFGLSLVAEQVALSVQYGADGLQRVGLSRLSDAARRTVTIVAATVTAMVTGRLDSAVAASAIAGVCWAVVVTGAVVLGARGQARPARPHREDVRRILRSGSEVGGLTAVGVGHRSMDRLLAAWLFGPTSVGIVEIATQVQNAASAVLSASSYVATASAPWLESSGAVQQQRDLLLRGTRLVMLATVPVVLVLGILADPLLDVWLGGPGDRAATLVPIALVYIGVSAPLQVASNMLLGTGRAMTIIRAALPSLIVNLVASVALARAFGLAGLFWGTVLGSVVLTPLLFRAARAMVPVTPGELLAAAVVPCLRPAAALAVMLTAALLAPLPALATLVAGALLGGAAFVLAALRYSVQSGEVTELRAGLRLGAPPADDHGAP